MRRQPRFPIFFSLVAALIAATPGLGAAAAAGGVRWTVPARWKEKPEKPMRVATYAVPAAPGKAAAEPECGVFYFGKGQGGSVEENLSRWTAQFEGASAPKKETRTVAGLRVHVTDVSGTYLAAGGPTMQTQEKRPDYRLLGAIVEAPEGLVFFKLTGPSAAVAAAKADFDALVKSLTKAPNL